MLASQQIIFIDSNVADYQLLANGVIPGIEVVILKSDRNGIAQVTEVISQKPYSTVHIVSHGSPGCLYLGNTQLNLDNFNKYQEELKTWTNQLSIAIYGCNVAAGDAGEEFINKLHDITGAEIAASTTPIGNSKLGGNWDLNCQTDANILPNLVFTPQIQRNYSGILEEDDPLAPELTEDLAEDIATITTDLDDYAPGSTATITGENFEPGETVELQILHTDGTPNTGGGHDPWQITDGSADDLDGEVNGTIITTWFVNPDDSGGSAFELTAAGLNSGKLANHYFTDSEPAVQFFYVPFEEDDIETVFDTLDNPGGFRDVNQQLDNVLSITISTDNTIVYYDHWEDNDETGNAYEADLNNPTQTETQIWGDNNPDNGIAPGFTIDKLNAGDIITLSDTITTDTNPNTQPTSDNPNGSPFGGRDKIGASKAVVVTRQVWSDGTGSLLAGAAEILDTSKWGTEFIAPVGEDTPSDNMFQYTSLFVTASQDGTNITITNVDDDNDGLYDDTITATLDEGETYFAENVGAGATVNSGTKPIQAHLVTGDTDEQWESRWYTLFPKSDWSNTYYTPVGETDANRPVDIFLYNPEGNGTITVTSSENTEDPTNNFTASNTFTINEGEVAHRRLQDSSAVSFTTGSNGSDFFAIATVDSPTSNDSNLDAAIADWGFSLIPDTNLTPIIQVGWGIGSEDNAQNGSPLWVTTTASTTIYVDYDGDGVAPNTDINGGQYDEAFTLGELESRRIFDTRDNDQTGIRVYTVDGTDVIAAWGQDPSTAVVSNSNLDLGTTVLPLPVATSWKTADLVTGLNANGDPGDVDADGNVDPGDTIEYTINIQNDGIVVLGNVNVSDIVPEGTSYVPGSKTINGVPVGDDATGTTFPLDDDGLDNGIDNGRNIGNIESGESGAVSFQVKINDPYDGSLEGIINSANVDSDTDSFTVAVNQPIDFTDVVQTKTLYLSDDSGSNNLDRIDPANSGNTDSTSIFVGTNNLIGVDFDTASGFAPPNWTEILNTTTTSFPDLQDDTGSATVFDLNLSYLGTSSTGAINDTASTVPSNLSNNIDYNVTSDTGITATWSDLDPLTSYDVYVFGLGADAINQNVAITGNTALTPFTQNTAAGNVFINNSIGDSGNTLESYATQVISDGFGDITIDVTPNSGDAGIAGLAIEPTSEDSITFNQIISMQSDFGMPSGQPVEVTAYIDVSNGTPTTASDITANLTYDSGTLLNLNNPTSVTLQSGTIYEVKWLANLDSNNTIASDEAISLDITNNDAALDFQLRYDGSGTFASKIDLPTISVIDITDIGIYDANNNGGNLVNAVSQGDSVYVRVEVEDPFGDYDITSLDINIKDANGNSVLTGGVAETLTGDTGDIDFVNVDGKRIYEYAWTPTTSTNPGNYTVEVEAFEGFEGTISDTDSTTISVNDGSVPDLVIGDSTVTEGDQLVFDVQLSGGNPHTTDIVLDLTTTNGTATGISDYEATVFEYSIDGGTTWISAGGTNGTEVTIPVGNDGIKVRIDSTDDTTDEPDETFVLGVGSVVSGSVGDTSDTGLGTILDNDNPPAISIDDVTLTEGNSNTKEYTFTVTLDNPSTETVTVDYATADGTAQVNEPVDGNDYTAANGTLTFAPGETSKTITVLVNGDTPIEPDETFTVDLTNATNATISDNQGVGTIVNDDGAPLFSINDVTIVEGDSGTQTLEFTVTRSGDTDAQATVDYATADDTATIGNNDYEAISGTLSFAPGELTQTISVTINGDLPPELDESFFVNLSNAVNVTTPGNGATIVDSQGVGIIQNDDASGTISGNVKEDTNNSNTGDTPLPEVTIELLDTNGNSVDSDPDTVGIQPTITTTDSNGDYQFANVALGDYQVKQNNLSGYGDVSEGDSIDNGTNDSDTDTVTDDNLLPVNLTVDGEIDSGNDFVDERLGSISGTVQADNTNDTIGDRPLANVTVELFNDGDDPNTATPIATAITDAGGNYNFPNVAPGDYDVVQTNLDSTYSDVKDIDTNPDGTANTANGAGNTNQNLIDVSLAPGQSSTGNDYVDTRGFISGTVQADSDDVDNDGDIDLANVTINLRDSSDNSIIATTTTDSNGEYFFGDLEPNTYIVEEVNLGGYSDVKDLDSFTDPDGDDSDSNTDGNDNLLTVALAGGEADTGNDFVDEALPGSISGTVLEDTNGDGIGDTPLAGATVTLSGNGTNLSPVITDSSGTYTFSGLSAGTYTVTETNPANYNDVNELDSVNNGTNDIASEDNDPADNNQLQVVLAVNESDTGNDFIDEAQPGSISGTVFADTTGDGNGDATLDGAVLALLDGNNSPVLDGNGDPITFTTTATGTYTFNNLPPGDYKVVETDPIGYSSVSDGDVTDNDGGATGAGDTDNDSNTNTNDNTLTFSISAGENDTGNDFVDQQNGTISGTVLEDIDGASGSNTSTIPGVTVTLRDSGGNIVATDTTDSNGDYGFSDVVPGNYTVEESDLSTYSSVSDSDSDPDTISDDATNTNDNDNSLAVSLLPNETDSGNDFIDELNGSISGTVKADIDNNNDGDDPLSNVTIELFNDGDDPNTATPVAITTTDGGGNYSFSNVAPGDYQVVETNPTGYIDVNEADSVNDGANDGDNETTATNDNVLAVSLAGGESDTGNDFVDEQTGTISGTVSEDTVGGNGIAGVTITLTNTDTSTTVTTTTASDGTYNFADLAPGNYQIDETDLGIYNSVSDVDSVDDDGGASGSDNIDNDTNASTNDNQLIVALSAGESDTANNFVDELDATAGTISGQVLEDTDGDGNGDTPISGVLITLGGDSNATTTTASDGTYSFSGLADGNYTLTETDLTSPTAYVSIGDTDGDNDNAIAVTLSGSSANNDFIDGLPASISGAIWSDFDANGLEGNFEEGVNGLTVTLIEGGADGVIGTGDDVSTRTATTDADGSYSFTGLNPGEEYQVQFPTSATGYSGLTTQDTNSNSNDLIDSDANTTNGTTGTITLLPNEDKVNVDAGLLPDEVINVGGTSVSETLGGGTGNEIIAGYKGQDTLSGGGGSDTFFFNETSDGVDVITDFNDSGSDKIDLRQILATEVPAANAFNVLSSGYVLFTQYATLGTMVQVDFDGSAGSLNPKSVVLLQGDDVGTLDTSNVAGNDDFLFF